MEKAAIDSQRCKTGAPTLHRRRHRRRRRRRTAAVSVSCKEMASMANRNTDFERCDDRPMQDGGADSGYELGDEADANLGDALSDEL